MTAEQRERVERWASLWERDAQNLFSNGFDKRGAEFDADAAALRAVLAEADQAAKLREALGEVIRVFRNVRMERTHGITANPAWIEQQERHILDLAARALRQEGKG